MKIGLFAGFVAVLLTLSPSEAGSIPPKPPLAAVGGEVIPQKDSQAARPFSAVLRYGPATMSACHNLSDNSSAICLLLALHVMQLSQKRVTETRL
jgi:hypothetical protein